MKQTAVEWLVGEVELISNSRIVSKEKTIELYNQAIKKAKEMEKEQIKDSYEEGYSDGYPDNGKSGEQYYNETYKQL
jgi:hypothetical protein